MFEEPFYDDPKYVDAVKDIESFCESATKLYKGACYGAKAEEGSLEAAIRSNFIDAKETREFRTCMLEVAMTTQDHQEVDKSKLSERLRRCLIMGRAWKRVLVLLVKQNKLPFDVPERL